MRRATTDAINGCNTDIISIHALLAESDLWWGVRKAGGSLFLSTLSLRRATITLHDLVKHFFISIHALLAESDIAGPVPRSGCIISIHALLAESDLADCTKIYAFGDFYPRSPCGERQTDTRCRPAGPISIHALLAESDGFWRITPEK